MSDVSDREKFDFERDKWREELGVRGRELALKEREQASSKWRSPLVVAILAATAAAVGNAVVAVVNGTQQVALENSKAESTRILEMTKTGDPETAARNLDFLLHSGLINDPDRVKKVTAFLATRAPGAGPSLPAPNGRVTFEPSDVMSEGMKQGLEKLMQDYVASLDKIGFPAGERVRVRIQLMPGSPNANYVENEIVIDPRIAADRSVPLREYNHHVLTTKHRQLGVEKFAGMESGQFAAIESGVADYLACSYLNNPRFGELAARTLGVQKPFLRNMANDRRFDGSAVEQHDLGEVWSGALWAMRTALGRDVLDPIIATAWLSTMWPDAEPEKPLAFATALVAAAGQRDPEKVLAVRGVLESRGFPVPH